MSCCVLNGLLLSCDIPPLKGVVESVVDELLLGCGKPPLNGVVESVVDDK